jgi:outer membrane lipoprotein carrier protein
VILGSAVGGSAFAALPVLMQEVQKEYRKSIGMEAVFEQSVRIKSTKTVKKANGRIWIKHPNKLRWETLSPDQNILISDGKIFWFYTPPFEKGDRGQVIIKKSSQVQTRFLNALLSGSFEFAKLKTEIETVSVNVFLLKPAPNTAGDVKTAEVSIQPDSKKIQKVVLTHTSGNETMIELKDVKLLGKIADGLFQFIPDRNTDQIRE